ncbi:hypothetical protein CIW62_18375 [Enterobacter cloacae]|uniref:hypothetical protein n=1 Tax=Enterobacter cloacae TaxID=550 RepID=UPI000BA879B4|nr:hypothetical protein [Enterobacter cloacae]PAN96898.1 hypothetical protein CIW62_18375 [Enterobacter cloacae]
MENTNIRTWKILDENQDTIRLVEITFFDEEANIRKIALFTEKGILFEWTPDMYRIKAIDDSYDITNQKVFGLRIMGDAPEGRINDAKTCYRFSEQIELTNLDDDDRLDYHLLFGRY